MLYIFFFWLINILELYFMIKNDLPVLLIIIIAHLVNNILLTQNPLVPVAIVNICFLLWHKTIFSKMTCHVIFDHHFP